ncbi:AAA family ATPase [Stieleria varia]|nr:AAA family ATPase [Stieleria varia]
MFSLKSDQDSPSDPNVKPDWEEIRLKACNDFIERKACHYIDMPARLTYDRFVFNSDPREGPNEAVDPIAFFAVDQCNPNQSWGTTFMVATEPYVAIVTGQFGVGKTELARQITDRVDAAAFPIMLSKCDGSAFSSKALDAEQMVRLLFRPLVDRESDLTPTVVTELLGAIRDGRVLLILDGLDELIFTVEGHEHFFESIANLLYSDDSHREYRVIVTVRTEYLRTFDRNNATDLVSRLSGKRDSRLGHSIPFVRLDYFTKTHLDMFLSEELHAAMAVHIGNYPALRELLRRPLLMRLFCDFVGSGGMQADDFEKLDTGVALIERYIKEFINFANVDDQLRQAQTQISKAVQWDLDSIARCSVRLYLDQRDYFTRDEIVGCSTGPKKADIDPFEAILKCPFVIRDNDGDTEVLRFAHRTFYEFFVAKGLALQGGKTSGGDADDEFTPFDEIVLETDIRRFLRTMEGDDWYNRTRRSYALERDQWDEWDKEFSLMQPNDAIVKELEEERVVLLDIMTEPEQFRADRDAIKAIRTINRFLDRPLQQLHPRYLMYNLEAVSVYVKAFGWESSAIEINHRLSSALYELLNKIVRRKLPTRQSRHSQNLRSGYELLVTRMLLIAKQMRYPWMEEFRRWGDPKKLEKEIGSVRSDTNRRVSNILNE